MQPKSTANRSDPQNGRRERGSILPLIAALVLLGSLFMLGAAKLGSAMIARARVDSVADVVALSAVTGGVGGAREVAEANEASLLNHLVRSDGSTLVEVKRGPVTGRAAAVGG